jgi:glycosyltransferase involved in cell wall biosynthesis
MNGGVLFVHPSDEPYGADRVLASLAEGLKAHRRDVAVLLPDDQPPGWLSDRLAELGIPVVRGPLAPARRRYLSPAGLPGFLRALWRARRFVRSQARGRGAVIVHLNTTALLVGLILGRPGGARVVWHVHEIVRRPRALAWLFRMAPGLAADRVVAVSNAVAGHLGRPGRARIRVVWNGIAPGRNIARVPQEGGMTVAYVGRLNRWKGYELFVAAAGLAGALDRSMRFVVAGDPPTGEAWRTADLADRVQATGLADRFRLLGRVDDTEPVYETADVLAVPSIWPDPFPTVILEGMRAGCVVVAAAHGGAPEMLEEDVTGLLVPPGDAAALADALTRLVRDPSLRARLGEAAQRSVAKRFTLERFVAGVEAVYAELGA